MPNKLLCREGYKSKTIVYGAFRGMGDLLCASSVIRSELEKGHNIKLLLSGAALVSFTDLIDFGANRCNLQAFQLPLSGSLSELWSFIRQMASFRADLIWVSPHASREASSWKIPIFLWLVKTVCWPHAVLAGAWDERLSSLFDLKVPLDRSLPLAVREWVAYSRLNGSTLGTFPGLMTFIERIRRGRQKPALYDLLIAPGANAKNRLWPVAHYVALVQLIPSNYRIAVVGLQSDVEEMRQALPSNRRILYLTGTLEDAICAIARSRTVLTMDSGNMHFANALNVPGIAIFGKADPASIIPAEGSMLPVYEEKFPCQPCNSARCSQREVYCMNAILPETVARVLTHVLQDSRTDAAVQEPR
jgi:heptosyltransferase-2